MNADNTDLICLGEKVLGAGFLCPYKGHSVAEYFANLLVKNCWWWSSNESSASPTNTRRNVLTIFAPLVLSRVTRLALSICSLDTTLA